MATIPPLGELEPPSGKLTTPGDVPRLVSASSSKERTLVLVVGKEEHENSPLCVLMSSCGSLSSNGAAWEVKNVRREKLVA